jgi:hypothetical protein
MPWQRSIGMLGQQKNPPQPYAVAGSSEQLKQPSKLKFAVALTVLYGCHYTLKVQEPELVPPVQARR